MNLSNRQGMPLLIVLVVCAGLGIGALLALAMKQFHPQTQLQTQTTVATTTIDATTAPIATSTPQVSVAPAATAAPTSTATAVPTATPAPRSTSAAELAGSWRIDEANVHVGTIVWSGASSVRGNTMTLQLHKESVAGRAAAPCERATTLELTVSPNSGEQTVPYREINCAGTTSRGYVRVGAIGTTSFTGSFWDGDAKLGDFNASRV